MIHDYYGTEGNGFVYCNSEQWLAHKGTVGPSLLGPVHVLDEVGDDVATGETGTIYFESSAFAYHHDPEKTAEYDPQGRAGRRWATWATSTRTAPLTRPTGGRRSSRAG